MPRPTEDAAVRAAVVVLNWNGWANTLSCLDGLDDLATEHDLVVVDNGSTDRSEERIRQARPGVHVLQTGANLGYAGGNNAGVRRALGGGAEFVWLLNNDARPHPAALAALIAAARPPDVGIVASAVRPPVLATALHAGEHVRCDGCEAGFHEADLVLGPSLFVRAAVFRDIGLLDERYFHYAEEQDLAMRAQRAGWRLGLACTSIVEHEHGGSLPVWSPQASYYKLRNLILYEQRFHGRGALAFAVRERERVRSHLALGTSLRERDVRRIVAVTLAFVDAARGRTGERDLGDRYRSMHR